MDQPSWLAAAWAEFGVGEEPGTADNPAILDYYREVGAGGIAHDETPWCAAFAGAMLKRGGYTQTGSLLARSYLGWGAPIDVPVPGAITILVRDGDTNAGHVGFFVGRDKARVFILGGNQSNRVNVAAFAANRVIAYRWPADPAAAPAPDAEASSIFARALAHVLAMEGGFSDDPYDPGGPTNRGITLSDFASWKGVTADATSRAQLVEDLKHIPDQTVRAIYDKRYWQPASCENFAPAIAVMHFDAAVNHGVGGAIRMLQTALGVATDGEVGPQTRAAAAKQSAPTIVARYGELRRARYRALPHFWRFGRGWLRRVDATEALALSLAGETPRIDEQAKGTTDMDQGFTFPLPGDAQAHPVPGDMAGGKWWPQSKTVWGTLITAITTVLPLVGPLIGINIPADVVKVLGDQSLVVIQALGGLIGTLLALYGRVNATAPLVRRDVNVRI